MRYPTPGIMTTLVLSVLPLLALKTPVSLVDGLTQDTIRRAEAQETNQPQSIPNQLRTVVLDAGHGGKDPGTHGRYVKRKTST